MLKSRLIAGALLIAVALGAGAPAIPRARAAATLSFWIRSSEQGFVQPVVAAYNASHATQVKLTLIPDQQFVATFGAAVAGGTPPDVVSLDTIYPPAFAAAHDLSDVTALAHKLPYFATFNAAQIRLATYQGKLYGVPLIAGGSILMYNKVLFREAGLNPNDPPRTWAAIEKDARKITALGPGTYGFSFPAGCSGCNAYSFLPLIWASGGDVLSPDGRRATLEGSPAVKEALTFYRRLWTEHMIPPSVQTDDWVAGFMNGTVGIVAGGANYFPAVETAIGESNLGVTYLPGRSGGWASFIGGDTISIPRGSRQPTAAWDFISWCLSPSVQIDQFAKNGSTPVRADLAINRYTESDPRLATVASATAHGRAPYSLFYDALFNDQNSPWETMIQEAVFGGKIDQAIARAQQRFTHILSRSQ